MPATYVRFSFKNVLNSVAKQSIIDTIIIIGRRRIYTSATKINTPTKYNPSFIFNPFCLLLCLLLFFLFIFAQWFSKKRNRQFESSFFVELVVFLLIKISVASFTFLGVFVSSAMRFVFVNYHLSFSVLILFEKYTSLSPSSFIHSLALVLASSRVSNSPTSSNIQESLSAIKFITVQSQ